MKNTSNRLRIAIQKSGRLNTKSLSALNQAGLDFDIRASSLIAGCRNFPIDLMLVRDDDIPAYVGDGVCEMGVVGENLLFEHDESKMRFGIETIIPLGFGRCRLAIAVPTESSLHAEAAPITDIAALQHKRVATSYPLSLQRFAQEAGIDLQPVLIAGAVEIAPSLGVADAVCDLVSTGSTLRANGLVELATVFRSQAVLVRSKRQLDPSIQQALDTVVARLRGVVKAASSKYIMMNAPVSAVERITAILPGMEAPTVMPLSGKGDRVAIHAVAAETVFWEMVEDLKAAGAESVLVMPIEKMM